jgi:hypothetical protein
MKTGFMQQRSPHLNKLYERLNYNGYLHNYIHGSGPAYRPRSGQSGTTYRPSLRQPEIVATEGTASDDTGAGRLQ